MKILKKEDLDLNLISSVLKNSGLIVYPTETCYGVGVVANDSKAVDKLMKFKKRPKGKAISVAVKDKEAAEKLVSINKVAENIYNNFLPGPVTVISKSLGKVDPRLENEERNLGIRISSNLVLKKILDFLDLPITATSANSSGKKTPYCISDILENLSHKQKKLIDLIIDAGILPLNLPSTVVDTTKEDLISLRSGAIDFKNAEVHLTQNQEETIKLAEEFMKINCDLENNSFPMIILLNGDMGAGKTHFAKGIAKFLQIKSIVKSPTYNYFEEYDFSIGERDGKLLHVDAWRITNKEDLEFLDLKRYFKKENIVLIEWPNIISALDPEFFADLDLKKIYFQIINENTRKIIFAG